MWKHLKQSEKLQSKKYLFKMGPICALRLKCTSSFIRLNVQTAICFTFHYLTGIFQGWRKRNVWDTERLLVEVQGTLKGSTLHLSARPSTFPYHWRHSLHVCAPAIKSYATAYNSGNVAPLGECLAKKSFQRKSLAIIFPIITSEQVFRFSRLDTKYRPRCVLTSRLTSKLGETGIRVPNMATWFSVE